MASSKTKKHLADIRSLIKDEDLAAAVQVLREGLEAEDQVSLAARRSGNKAPTALLKSRPNHEIRLASAKLLLEYGFGKPLQQQRIELPPSDEESGKLSPEDVVKKLQTSGVDMQQVLGVYVANLPQAVEPDNE
jgi:hypothetical protein